MEIDIITRQDLVCFKNELIAEFKDILRSDPHRYPKLVRSADVRKILGVSSSTLQNIWKKINLLINILHCLTCNLKITKFIQRKMSNIVCKEV